MDSKDFDRAADSLREMHRNRPERRLAGVCAALADHLGLPLPVVRAAFLLGALIPSTSGPVILLYLAIWFVTPPALGERSGLDRVIETLRDLFGVGGARRRDDLGSDEVPSDPSA
jgi:phage shock protein PspC (stress-responsive transcriptional regulator)